MSTYIPMAVDCQHVDVIFGNQSRAITQLDAGKSRETIQKTTGAVVAVHDATLQVHQDEICVLMGLSGSGKSSLLRCINGLNPIARGSLNIHCCGETVDMTKPSKKSLLRVRRYGVAMVFQQFGLLPWHNVRDNVAFGLRNRGMNAEQARAAIEQILAMVQLQDWANYPISALSGGMLQRVGLARALVTDPDILLMDEPFSALDPLIRDHLQDELLKLQQTLHKTILFVSHDLDEALKIGDRIVLMESGKIVQIGTPAEIVAKPATDYVRNFVANINPLNILTAELVMQPLPTQTTIAGYQWDGSTLHHDRHPLPDCHRVSRKTPIRELLTIATAHDRPLLVTDSTNAHSAAVGWVQREDLLRCLS